MRTYQELYQSIDLPFFAPPAWVFGLAWSIIYPLIIAAGIYLLYLRVKKRIPGYFLLLFGVNLAANLLFSPLQLGLESFWPATVDILIILITLVWLEVLCFQKAKPAFYLLLPYLLWGSFATVLQISINLLN